MHEAQFARRTSSLVRPFALLAGVCGLGASLLLGGCAVGTTASTPVTANVAFSGRVVGGQQVVSGTNIYLYAVSQNGYAAPATSLLGAPGYVTSDANGNWSISGSYTCPAGAYVYVLGLGGNPGLTAGSNNPKLGLMSGLGPCASLTPATRVVLNEATTVATAYALAAFMNSETAVGTSSTNVVGMQNAFGNIANLVNPISGQAPPMNSAGGTAPILALNALANAISACVNSNGTTATCSSLMTAANVTGAGGTPVDTIQAAINIAHNPGVNVSAIYNLGAANSAFQPTLSAAPNDWTMVQQYPGVNQAQGLAVDATGNVIVANLLGANFTKMSPSGTVIYTGSSTTMFRPQQPAIDINGNYWFGARAFTNTSNNVNYAANLTEFAPNGALLSGPTGFTGGGLVTPRGLAFDPSGNAWAVGASEISKFSAAGVPISPASGYTGGGLQPLQYKIAIDTQGSIWSVGFDPNNQGAAVGIAKFSNAGVALSPAGGFAAGTIVGGAEVAIDGSNNVWADNDDQATTGSVAEYSPAGATIAGPFRDGGLAQPNAADPNDIVIDGTGRVFTSQGTVSVRSKTGVAISPATGYVVPLGGSDCCLGAAIDGSGNLWLGGGTNMYVMIGVASPVVTPIVKAVVNGTIATLP